MTVEMFNIAYFIPIIITIVFTTLFILLFKNKSDTTKNRVIVIMLFFNLALHFAKLFFLPYSQRFPTSIRKVTFENICAVSTLIFPFIYLSKKRPLRDYMYYVGVLGGIAALLVPTEALGNKLFVFDSIRFYTSHIILFLAPVLMLSYKLHKLNYKKVWQSIFLFFGVLTLIMVNELILSLVGLSDIKLFFSRHYRNNSFVFGPTKEFDDFANKFFLPFVPKFLRTNYFNLNVDQFFFPILWLFFPVFIYFTPLFLLFGFPFNGSQIINDFSMLFKDKEKAKNQ